MYIRHNLPCTSQACRITCEGASRPSCSSCRSCATTTHGLAACQQACCSLLHTFVLDHVALT